jgi:hypothetical protein
MSNEIEPVSPDNMLAMMNENIDQPVESASISEVAPAAWIPALSIAYAVSDSFKKGIAKEGDFVLANQTSLGNSVEVICFDYRIHSIIFNTEETKFVDEFFIPSTYKGKLASHEEYQKFLATTLKKDEEIQEGTDLFLYIPSQTAFATMFFKKMLARDAEPIYAASKPGGRLVKLHTVQTISKKNAKRSWYNVICTPTMHAVKGSLLQGMTADISVPQDKWVQMYQMFINPQKGATTAAEAAPEVER